MSRTKTLKVLLTFASTTRALIMEQEAAKAQAPGRLVPIPVQISAGCGMAWMAPQEARLELLALTKEHGIEVEAVYELFM